MGDTDGEWGWEALEPEETLDGSPARAPASTSRSPGTHEPTGMGSSSDGYRKPVPITGNSQRSIASGTSWLAKPPSSGALKGITSSPSFQELEKAIGATLALSHGDSDQSLDSMKSISPSTSFSNGYRFASTDITQQKLQQQRMRQQQQYHQYQQRQHSSVHNRFPNSQISHSLPPSNLSAKEELGQFINESESRAIILFHSSIVAPLTIRNACSKFGVLYYIRPDFHRKGLTLLSYFDLRAATVAKAMLCDELGADAVASAHFSVMLHAANGNSEESCLVARNLPAVCSESDVEAIFGRYGQLRSIQKSYDDRQEVGADEPVGAGAGRGASMDVPSSSSSTSSASTTYTVEYYNIQDARLAVSELSATSAHIWGSDTSVSFSALDERRQQLCRQLLATLSRWRSEMAMMQQQQLGVLSAAQGMHSLSHVTAGMPIYGPPVASGLSVSMMNAAAAARGNAMLYQTQSLQQQQQQQQQQQVYPQYPQYQQQYQQQYQHGAGLQSMQAMALPLATLYENGEGNPPVSQPSLYTPSMLDSSTQPRAQQVQVQRQAYGAPQAGFVGPVTSSLHEQHAQLDQLSGSSNNNSNSSNSTSRGLLNHYTGYSAQPTDASTSAFSARMLTGSAEVAQYAAPAAAGGDQQSVLKYRAHNRGSAPHHVNNTSNPNPSSRGSCSLSNENSAALSYETSAAVVVAGAGVHQSPGLSRPLHHNGGYSMLQSGGVGAAGGVAGTGGAVSGGGAAAYGVHGLGGRARAGRGGAAGGGYHSNSASPDTDYSLNLQRIDSDLETRTTVMVRNIPNKYNQQMLLEEVNARHEGTYDFFYLPIDFKNKCNVGYCFVNFLEPKHIAPFVREFNGQRWKSFNSEKVCAVTFARIQGKGAMIARFQNSSLLEKDNEYQPLLFYSSGPNRGRPEPFPIGSRHQHQQHHQQQQQQQQQQLQLQKNQQGTTTAVVFGGGVRAQRQILQQQQQQQQLQEPYVVQTSERDRVNDSYDAQRGDERHPQSSLEADINMPAAHSDSSNDSAGGPGGDPSGGGAIVARGVEKRLGASIGAGKVAALLENDPARGVSAAATQPNHPGADCDENENENKSASASERKKSLPRAENSAVASDTLD